MKKRKEFPKWGIVTTAICVFSVANVYNLIDYFKTGVFSWASFFGYLTGLVIMVELNIFAAYLRKD